MVDHHSNSADLQRMVAVRQWCLVGRGRNKCDQQCRSISGVKESCK